MIRCDRFAELDALIAAGWGDISPSKIPSDWRERRGPCRIELVRKRARNPRTVRSKRIARIVRNHMRRKLMEAQLCKMLAS